MAPVGASHQLEAGRKLSEVENLHDRQIWRNAMSSAKANAQLSGDIEVG
jgi:hypothetical protein